MIDSEETSFYAIEIVNGKKIKRISPLADTVIHFPTTNWIKASLGTCKIRFYSLLKIQN